MLKKIKKTQSGVMLMELILAVFILSLFIAGIFSLMQKQEKLLKNKATASYMEELLSATVEYVDDNYDILLDDLKDTSTYPNNTHKLIVQTDLIDNGYLSQGFKLNMSPYGDDAEIIITKDKDEDINLFVLLPSEDKLSTQDSVKIASLITNGNGGTYFTANAPANPCGGIACVQGTFGLWTYDLTDLGNNFNDLTPALASTESTPVAYTKYSNGVGPFLARNKAWNNLGANTMNTDLNITNTDGVSKDEVKIFFNANTLDNNDEFAEGVHLYHTSTDNGAGGWDNTLTLQDDTAASNQPILSSDGGLSTGLIIDTDTNSSCNFGEDKGKMALNKNQNFIYCDSTSGNWQTLAREAIKTSKPTSYTAVVARVTNTSSGNKHYRLVYTDSDGNINTGSADLTVNNADIIGYIE